MARINISIELDSKDESLEDVLADLIASKQIVEQAPITDNGDQGGTLTYTITDNGDQGGTLTYTEPQQAPPPADPTPPAPPAADPTPPAPPADTPSLNLDSEQMPWDERIHASTRTTTASGAWKKRRGVDKAIIMAVEAEIKSLTTSTAAATVDTPPPPPPPVPASENQEWTWPTLLRATTQGAQAKQFTVDDRNDALALIGVEEFSLLSTQPGKWGDFANALGLTAS